MMSIRAFGDGTLYVSFPMSPRWPHKRCAPPEVDEWLTEHNIDEWGMVKESKMGVFLSGEDAVAFKLKFRL